MMNLKKLLAALAAAGTVAVSATACTVSAHAVKTPGPTVTKTQQVPGPAVTQTQQVPGPTVTKTVPPTMNAKHFSGTGDWTSPPLVFGCTEGNGPLTVAYTYTRNDASNFMAEVDGADGEEVGEIANEIGTQGSKITNVYPDTYDTPPFHISVTATGSWTIATSCIAN